MSNHESHNLTEFKSRSVSQYNLEREIYQNKELQISSVNFPVFPSETDGNIVLVSGQGVQTGYTHQDAKVLETEGGQRLPDAHLGNSGQLYIQLSVAPYPAGILHTLIELGDHVHLE